MPTFQAWTRWQFLLSNGLQSEASRRLTEQCEEAHTTLLSYLLWNTVSRWRELVSTLWVCERESRCREGSSEKCTWNGVNGGNVLWNRTRTKCLTILILKKKIKYWFWGISFKWGITLTNHTKWDYSGWKKRLESQRVPKFYGGRPYKIPPLLFDTSPH